jgi:hypothetical protein
MAVGSTSSSSPSKASATSSAPTSSPRPESRPTSEQSAAVSAQTSSGVEATAQARTSPGESDAAAVAGIEDRVSLSTPEQESTGLTEALSAGLQDAYGVEAAEASAPQENPYEGFADHTVTMSPEAWSKDRTPAEGDVARNDHLEGMMRNQGYSVEDIYARDAGGQSLLDRVAQANGLRDPNLITPEQSLVLPTRNAPPQQESNASAAAAISGESEDTLSAQAQAEVKADDVEDAALSADAVARAENTGSGDAVADASARVDVGEAVDSTLTARAQAEALAAEGSGEATAVAEVVAGRIEGTETEAVALATGDEAVAQARTTIGEAVDSHIVSEAVASGPGSRAEGLVEIAEADEDTSVDSRVIAQGPEATALNSVELNGPAGVRLPGEQTGTARLETVATGNTEATVGGTQEATATTVSHEGTSRTTVDSAHAAVLGVGQDVEAIQAGQLNESNFNLVAEDTAVIHDVGATFAGGNTGNTISGSVLAQNLDLRSASAESTNISFIGREGDNNVSLSGPRDSAGATFQGHLGDGTDSVTGQLRSEDEVLSLNKESGILDLGLRFDGSSEGTTESFIDAGDAVLRGELRGSEYGQDRTMIRGGRFEGLTLDGGHGANDELIIDLPEGAAVPAVFTGSNQGAIPEGWQDGQSSISAPNYERIVVRQNGEVVGQFGEAIDYLPSFERAQEDALSRGVAP